MNNSLTRKNERAGKAGGKIASVRSIDHFLQNSNIIDLLKTSPSPFSLTERIKRLELNRALEAKALRALEEALPENRRTALHLAENDEKELATEVLLLRHAFTRQVFATRCFRQAVLTIVQNIYLFRQRRIFFGTVDNFGEPERQKALQIFSQSPDQASIPLAQTFQHLMIARIWDRIVSTADEGLLKSTSFQELHAIVDQLNTLRNIYMLLSTGLVRKLTQNIGGIYRQSVSPEDAAQIGSFGIARAAYRYHPAQGMRFSTYASYWILREIQRQALAGRLIRISANLVENIAREAKNPSAPTNHTFARLSGATALLAGNEILENFPAVDGENPEKLWERKELKRKLAQVINTELPPKSRDILRRRYGMGKYRGREQSVIAIAKIYGVSRSSIYQQEQTALRKLRQRVEENVW